MQPPSFQTLVGLPQLPGPEGENGDKETSDGLPVVRVSESSKTLDAFLRFC